MARKIARDRDTGRILTDEQATKAADNPLIYKWVEWIDPDDAQEG